MDKDHQDHQKVKENLLWNKMKKCLGEFIYKIIVLQIIILISYLNFLINFFNP